MLETVDPRTSSAGFARWLDEELTLTPTELRILHALGYRFGTWCAARSIVRAVWRDTYDQELYSSDLHCLRAHISRIRRKLERSPWRIETRIMHGLYRLVRRD